MPTSLAQYHLHPEDKFLNGDFLDRGTTIRRHVRVTEIEYIGKESNKWEDHYYFGFDPEDHGLGSVDRYEVGDFELAWLSEFFAFLNE